MGTYIFACTWKDSMFDIHKLLHLIKYSIKQPAKDLQKNIVFMFITLTLHWLSATLCHSLISLSL